MTKQLLQPAGLVEDVPSGIYNDPEEIQLVTFVIGERYGIPVRQVHEIIRAGRINKVPTSPPYIEGIMNLRGRILPVLNLRKRFGLPVKEVTKTSRIVVVESGDKIIGLLVDAVDHITKISAGYIENVPMGVLDFSSLCKL